MLEVRNKKKIETVGQAVEEVAPLAAHEFYRSGAPPGVKRLRIGAQQLTSKPTSWRLSRVLYAEAGTVK